MNHSTVNHCCARCEAAGLTNAQSMQYHADDKAIRRLGLWLLALGLALLALIVLSWMVTR